MQPTNPPLVGGLVILQPPDGTIVSDRTIIVRGLAPAGVTVTRDVPLWFDEHTTADARGRWSFAVPLAPGENVLTFRIGSDKATARTVTVHLRPD